MRRHSWKNKTILGRIIVEKCQFAMIATTSANESFYYELFLCTKHILREILSAKFDKIVAQLVGSFDGSALGHLEHLVGLEQLPPYGPFHLKGGGRFEGRK